MSIVMDESIRAIVFAPFSDKSDIMFAVKEMEGGGFKTEGRLRFYGKSHGDPFLDEDRKKWFEGRHEKRSLEEVITGLEEVVGKLELISIATGFRTIGDEMTVLRRGASQTLDDFMDEFMKQPFAYKKVLS